MHKSTISFKSVGGNLLGMESCTGSIEVFAPSHAVLKTFGLEGHFLSDVTINLSSSNKFPEETMALQCQRTTYDPKIQHREDFSCMCC